MADSDGKQALLDHELARRSLLRLALAGAASGVSSGAFAQSETPKHGGRLTIGADADPIGLAEQEAAERHAAELAARALEEHEDDGGDDHDKKDKKKRKKDKNRD